MSIASIVLLNFHVNVTSGGFASSSHGILVVSCRATPNTFTWPWWQTGVTEREIEMHIQFRFLLSIEYYGVPFPRYFIISYKFYGLTWNFIDTEKYVLILIDMKDIYI